MCNMTSKSNNLNNFRWEQCADDYKYRLICEGSWLVTISSPSENILEAWVNHSHKYGKLHLYYMSINVQQDATIHTLFYL